MNTKEIKYMRPSQILAELERTPAAYLPVGLLEWHNPANPFGLDALQAEASALAAAEKAGGTVFPTLYCGTGRIQSEERLKLFGFVDTNQRVNGVDFPPNTVDSYYYRHEVAAVVLRENLRLIVEHGYKLVVIVLGHAENGLRVIIDRLCEEFTATTDATVICAMGAGGVEGVMMAHAGTLETANMLYCHPDCVDLTQLPPKPEILYKRDWGIIDLDFDRIAADGRVLSDPRDATAEMGRSSIQGAADAIAALVESFFK